MDALPRHRLSPDGGGLGEDEYGLAVSSERLGRRARLGGLEHAQGVAWLEAGAECLPTDGLLEVHAALEQHPVVGHVKQEMPARTQRAERVAHQRPEKLRFPPTVCWVLDVCLTRLAVGIELQVKVRRGCEDTIDASRG
jgi:hypothetical protein